jgi:hypothetical protein
MCSAIAFGLLALLYRSLNREDQAIGKAIAFYSAAIDLKLFFPNQFF